MQVVAASETPLSTSATAMVIGLFEDQLLTGTGAALDEATDGLLSRLETQEEFTGKSLQLLTLIGVSGLPTLKTVLVGLGKEQDYNTRTAMRAASAASKLLADKTHDRVAFFFPTAETAAAICGAIVGCVGQDLYRKERNLFTPGELIWCGDHSESEIAKGNVLGNSVNLTRELVNRPANDVYPESFANRCQEVANDVGIECEVWDEAKLTQERCGALLAVGRASSRESRLVIMNYQGGSKDDPPIAFVGKGVTFDSGGLSLKPTEGMKEMKCDMAGAATVLGAVQAIAQLKLNINVIGIVGLVENMVDGSAYKLGDVLTARNGKTIEVLNTDAEGRLVLADALDVAVENSASKIIDLATLTGACLVALGMDVAGVMSNDDDLSQELLDAAKQAGEDAWPLPMHKEFGEQIKSEIADIKNTGNGRWGGAITAAKFLEEFVADTPWCHIDIAGPSFAESAKPWIAGGASGAFVQTLVEFAQRQIEAK